MKRHLRNLEHAMPWLVCVGGLVAWELACVAFSVPEYILPRPTVVAVALVKMYEPVLKHSLHTLLSTLLGFALAVVLGGMMGVAIGASRLTYRGLYPVLVGFNSVPKVAVVPILVIWFGIGLVPAVITAFLVAFFPITVNVATGLATVEPELLDLLRSLGARKRDLLLKVGIPRSLPYFFASLKVAITLAFVGAVISETIASNEGIGYMLMGASSRLDVPLVFAGLIVISIMAIGMYELFAYFEKRMTGWAQRGADLSA